MQHLYFLATTSPSQPLSAGFNDALKKHPFLLSFFGRFAVFLFLSAGPHQIRKTRGPGFEREEERGGGRLKQTPEQQRWRRDVGSRSSGGKREKIDVKFANLRNCNNSCMSSTINREKKIPLENSKGKRIPHFRFFQKKPEANPDPIWWSSIWYLRSAVYGLTGIFDGMLWTFPSPPFPSFPYITELENGDGRRWISSSSDRGENTPFYIFGVRKSLLEFLYPLLLVRASFTG